MIKNAKDVPLRSNPGTLPNVSDAMANWFQRTTFTRVNKTVTNFSNIETPVSYYFMGVVQPFTAQQLQMKPEGQRQWKWFTIHAWPDLILEPDDVIKIDSTNYRIMYKWDYKEYGYVKYDCVEDYTS